jgi:hypothetical protein
MLSLLRAPEARRGSAKWQRRFSEVERRRERGAIG